MKIKLSNMKSHIPVLVAILFLSVFCLSPVYAKGPDRVSIDTTSPQTLKLIIGKSIIVESQDAVKRVSLTDPKISDAIVLTSHQIYLTGKEAGVTNLTLWGANDKVISIFDIEVSPNVSILKEKLHEMLPDEQNIRVTTSRDDITLSGSVSSTANLSQVLALAGAFAPKDKDNKPRILNLLEIAGINQVMLEVKVSEISRTDLKNMGIDLSALIGGRFLLTQNLSGFLSLPQSAQSSSASPNILGSDSGVMKFFGNHLSWSGIVNALKQNGMVKVLAEPTLITLSGQKASFLAGGEFPVPVAQASSGSVPTITIEWKRFGVELNFTPTVLNNKKISMKVDPSVSELNFASGVVLQGFTIPSLDKREVSTTVELADGQSFAVAGLLQDTLRTTVNKFPFLGDIPVLGQLFKSSNYVNNESELVIIVTPHLVKPLDMANQTLPTDQYIEPNDLEFFLLGTIEGRKGASTNLTKATPQPNTIKQDGLEGNYGHIVPE